MTLPKGYERLEGGVVREIGSQTEHRELKIECKHKYRNFFIGIGILGFIATLFFGNVVFSEYFPSVVQQLIILGIILLAGALIGLAIFGIMVIYAYFDTCDSFDLILGIFVLAILTIALGLVIINLDNFVPTYLANDDFLHKERVQIFHMSCDQLKQSTLSDFHTDSQDYFKHRLGACT